MTDNIRVLTEYEIIRIQDRNNSSQPVYATFENILEPVISIGSCTENNIEQILNHETIHETLTELFNSSLSFQFDRDLYYNFELCKKGELCKDTIIRETLISMFTIEGTTFI